MKKATDILMFIIMVAAVISFFYGLLIIYIALLAAHMCIQRIERAGWWEPGWYK